MSITQSNSPVRAITKRFISGAPASAKKNGIPGFHDLSSHAFQDEITRYLNGAVPEYFKFGSFLVFIFHDQSQLLVKLSIL